MNEITSSDRKRLRALAHSLSPVCYVGKNGVSPALLESVNIALLDHELIKVKFIDGKEAKKELTAQIAEHTESHVVGVIGNIAILYRQHPDPEKRKIPITPQ